MESVGVHGGGSAKGGMECGGGGSGGGYNLDRLCTCKVVVSWPFTSCAHLNTSEGKCLFGAFFIPRSSLL